MSNLKNIFKENASTYYRYDTDEKKPIWARLLGFFVLAVAISLLVQEEDNFLVAVLSFQSILIRLIPLSQVSLACGYIAPHNAAWPGDTPP
jgi:hypothetical protein